MNYLKIYENLISKSKVRRNVDYVERHHIVPRCLGGSDENSNIAKLTPEEHYLAHQLLVKIYPNERKLVYALNMMLVGNDTVKRNNKTFGWIRRKISSAISENNSGKIPYNKGIPMKKSQIEKLSTKWKFIFPDGKEEIHIGLRDFCDKHELNASAMSSVCKGKRSHHKGFKCFKLDNVGTDDNRSYISKPKQGWKNQANRIPVLINGVKYASIHLASIDLKISRKKVEELNEYIGN